MTINMKTRQNIIFLSLMFGERSACSNIENYCFNF